MYQCVAITNLALRIRGWCWRTPCTADMDHGRSYALEEKKPMKRERALDVPVARSDPPNRPPISLNVGYSGHFIPIFGGHLKTTLPSESLLSDGIVRNGEMLGQGGVSPGIGRSTDWVYVHVPWINPSIHTGKQDVRRVFSFEVHSHDLYQGGKGEQTTDGAY